MITTLFWYLILGEQTMKGSEDTLRCKWEFCRKTGKEKRSKVLVKERLGKEEVREEYRGKLSERLRVGEEMSVNEVYDIFKSTVMEMKWWGGERAGEEKKEMRSGQMKLRIL